MSSKLVILFVCLSSVLFSQDTNSIDISKYDEFMPTAGHQFVFTNVDSVNNTADLKIQFYFSDVAMDMLIQDVVDSEKKPDSIGDALKENSIHTLTFKNIKFSPREGKIVSGNILFLDSLDSMSMNGNIQARVGVEESVLGNSWSLFIRGENGQWYYFTFRSGILSAVSGRKEFNKLIDEMSKKGRSLKGKKTESPYRYLRATINQKDTFLKW